MVQNYMNGNIKKARDAQLKCLPLVDALFCEVNPIPVKAALNLLGYNYGTPRLPLITMSEVGITKLEKAMKEFGSIS